MSLEYSVKKIFLEKTLADTAEQLACITRLVYLCGIQRQEIPQLTVGDVLDQNGNAAGSIRKFKNPLPLNEWGKAELSAQLDDLAERDDPRLLEPNARLFPDYTNVKKIYRHWKKAGIDYWEILQEGIGESVRERGWWETENQFRHTEVSISANLKGRGVIPPGRKRHKDFEELKEQADLIVQGSRNAYIPAEGVIRFMEGIIKNTKYPQVRQYRLKEFEKTKKKLKPFLPIPQPHAPVPPDPDDTDEDDD